MFDHKKISLKYGKCIKFLEYSDVLGCTKYLGKTPSNLTPRQPIIHPFEAKACEIKGCKFLSKWVAKYETVIAPYQIWRYSFWLHHSKSQDKFFPTISVRMYEWLKLILHALKSWVLIKNTFIQLKYLLGELIFDFTNLEAVQCTFKTEQLCVNNIYWNNTYVLHQAVYLQCFWILITLSPSLSSVVTTLDVSGDNYHMAVTRTRGMTTEHNNVRTRASKPETLPCDAVLEKILLGISVLFYLVSLISLTMTTEHWGKLRLQHDQELKEKIQIGLFNILFILT